MKKIPFLILLSGILTLCCAQPYESVFGKDSTVWYVYHEETESTTAIISPDNEILNINGKNYLKLVDHNYYSFFNEFVLREDTIEGKLWAYNLTDEFEQLVMDLSLEKGDTFYLNPDRWGKDSVSIVVTRKQICSIFGK